MKICSTVILACLATASSALTPTYISAKCSDRHVSSLSMASKKDNGENSNSYEITSTMPSTRKAFLASIITASATIATGLSNANAEEEEGFASIAARAANMAKSAEQEEDKRASSGSEIVADPRKIYDFSLPIAGNQVPLMELVKQQFADVEVLPQNEGDEATVKTETKVKAIVVVNIKQDDPIARKNIPELISLASKFGRTGEFAVICAPTDQGYYEPDTSALIRLKLASEYGYGINPATIVTDKMILLGTGADPFWRWIQGTCRAPSGLGRIQGNFEKFLVDGRTGKAIRRYPRKYQPFDMAEDIDAVMRGKALPPAGSNWREEWRNSDKEAERDVYRFQKGLNVFDH